MIPEQWYAVCESEALRAGRALPLRRMGLDLVLWRDAEGRPVVQQDRCPHRGAKLSAGRVRDGALACPYHGFRFDRAGACTAMPVHPQARIPRAMCVRTFPAVEAHGLVWLWWGDAAAVRPEVPWFDGLPEQDPNAASGWLEYPLHYSRVIESNFDVYHFPFVHRSLNWGGAFGEQVVDIEVTTDGDHVTSRGRMVKGPDDAEGIPFVVEFKPPNVQLLHLTSKVSGVVVATPIDEHRTWVWGRFHQSLTRLWPLGRLFTELMMVTEWRVVQSRQDIPVLATLDPPTAEPGGSVFVAADAGSARYVQVRARLLREAAARGAAPAALETPDAPTPLREARA